MLCYNIQTIPLNDDGLLYNRLTFTSNDKYILFSGAGFGHEKTDDIFRYPIFKIFEGSTFRLYLGWENYYDNETGKYLYLTYNTKYGFEWIHWVSDGNGGIEGDEISSTDLDFVANIIKDNYISGDQTLYENIQLTNKIITDNVLGPNATYNAELNAPTDSEISYDKIIGALSL